MMNDDIFFLEISELGCLFRKGEISPVDFVSPLLERIHSRQEQSCAYITVTDERAISDAQSAERAIRSGADLGPLHGIPVALKDLFHTAGIRTTSGSIVQREFVPETSATVVRKLEQSGSILLGKTNMVEFAFGPYGLNPHYGTPPNPWNTNCVPGGSSSGSAVAVASGLAVAALGTDTGGSIRVPASFCGIVGLKPTLERVSRAGVTPLSWSLDSVGPLARSVTDAALLFSAISGADVADEVTQGHRAEDVMKEMKLDVKGMRVGIVRKPFFEGAEEEVVEAVESAMKVMADEGVIIDELTFPEAEEELLAELDGKGSAALMTVEGYAVHRDLLAKQGEQFDPRIRDRILQGANVSGPDYAQVLQERVRLMSSALKTLRSVDAVVGPTAPTGAPRIDEVSKAPTRLTTRLVNFLGLCSISVPCGYSRKGLPIGLQVIGKPFDEGAILRLAYHYEQATSWHKRRPPGD